MINPSSVIGIGQRVQQQNRDRIFTMKVYKCLSGEFQLEQVSIAFEFGELCEQLL